MDRGAGTLRPVAQKSGTCSQPDAGGSRPAGRGTAAMEKMGTGARGKVGARTEAGGPRPEWGPAEWRPQAGGRS